MADSGRRQTLWDEYIEPMPVNFVHRLLDALPTCCAVCGDWPARPFCDRCVTRFAQPKPRCLTCALPLDASARRCGACLREDSGLDACITAVDYAYPWASCITGFKFGEEPGLARPLAALLARDPTAIELLRKCEKLIPMPLSAARLAERGFNQARELCRHLSDGKTDAQLLLRIRDTAPQSRLSREERQRNVRGAFMVEPLALARLQGRALVLVDDVMTSGASLRAAALALRQAGASAVSALVVARTAEPASALA